MEGSKSGWLLSKAHHIEPMKIDIYDGEPWTEMDVEDLTAALKSGDTIEDAAQHLCRSGTIDDVRRKAEERRATVDEDGHYSFAVAL